MADRARQLNNRGCDLMEAGDFAGARRCFDRPQRRAVSNNLVSCLVRLGEIDEALGVFERKERSRRVQGLGHADDAAVQLVALLCAKAMATTGARAGLAFLAAPVQSSDDRSRGQLGLVTIVAGALAGLVDRVWLRRVRPLLRKRGRRAALLAVILEPAFWEGEANPRREARLASADARVRWEWDVVRVVRDRLRGRRPRVDRLARERGAWTNPLMAILLHATARRAR